MRTDYFPQGSGEEPAESGINFSTAGILNAGFQASNQLGVGFLEHVYRNAVAHYLEKLGHHVEMEFPLKVYLEDGHCVGKFHADLLVDHRVIVELKVAIAIVDAHVGQILNYLRASRLQVGMILNFGQPKMQMRRVVNRYVAPTEV